MSAESTGVGPDQAQDMDVARQRIAAAYSVGVIGAAIVLIDQSEAVGGPTITNAAEDVIQELARAGWPIDRLPVIYRDTEGVYDELVVREARFVGFRALGVQGDLHAALAAVKAGPTIDPPPALTDTSARK